MADTSKRDLLKAGAAAATIAATPQVFAQSSGTAPAAPSPASPPQVALPGSTRFFEQGRTRIAYQEVGAGFPLLIIAGGGLNSTMTGLVTRSPFNPMAELSGEYRCIYADLRNANPGQSTGPVEADRPWDSHADDHLGLMDHLGVRRFAVLGFCIGGPFIWNLIRRAPERVAAGVLAVPVGFRPEAPTVLYDSGVTDWAPEFLKRRPDVSKATVDRYLTAMWKGNDFVFSVTRDFVRTCRTPLLIMPDDVPAHPYATAMESALLAPNAEVSFFPWKEPKERVALAVRQVRSFLKAHRPAQA